MCNIPALLAVAVSTSVLLLTDAASVLQTRSQPPIISSVFPSNVGSAEGGTELTITGANFAQGGLFSSRAVFVGGQTCKIINYYTSDERIVCITPKCVTPACLSDQDWQGYEEVSLSVYVSTVETILEGFSTYIYNGGYTPSVYKMQHTSWATGISQLTTKLMAQKLSDISVMIGDQFADLGDENEINGDHIDMWSRSSLLYYRAPEDMTGGFYNLSMTVKNDQTTGYYANGAARMYPNQKTFQYENGYFYDSNFDASLAGVSHSMCVLPVITAVSPASGSVAGGTVLTVRGHGFSAFPENMIVYVAGRPCDVISTGSGTSAGKTEEFRCRTRPAEEPPKLRALLDSVPAPKPSPAVGTYEDYFFTEQELQLQSTRNYGSAGWWMKLWDYVSYNTNSRLDSQVRFSWGLRQALSFSFIDLFGYYWPYQVNYDAKTGSIQVFTADLATYLVAPYEGTYYFYGSVDDYLELYGTRVTRSEAGAEIHGSEELLMTAAYNPTNNGNIYPTCTGCKVPKSRGIYLLRGERFLLRARFTNTQSYDQIEISMKIELPGHIEQHAAPRPTAMPVVMNTTHPSAVPSAVPTRNPSAMPSFLTTAAPTRNPTRSPSARPTRVPTARPSTSPTNAPSYNAQQLAGELPEEVSRQERSLSSTFLRHHSLKDVQIVQLHVPFRYEIQSIMISGVTSGTFKLFLQDLYPTSDLDFSSSTSTIASALSTAAYELSALGMTVECSSFGVTKALLAGGTALQLNITFYVSYQETPFTRTTVFIDDLKGVPVIKFSMVQFHTPPPSGTFQLSLPYKQQHLVTDISISATQRDFQLAVQAMSDDLTVDVTRRGDYYNGYVWTVTFLTPFGYVEPFRVDTTNDEVPGITADVLKAENGSTSALWYRYIPTYMTEVPLSWALGATADTPAAPGPASGVEVYVTTPSGDVLKALCDGAPQTNAIMMGMFKGTERTCAYHYATNVTAIVSSFSQETSDETGVSMIEILGSHFLRYTRNGNYSDPVDSAIPTGFAHINVTIAGHPCNLTEVTNKVIHCTVIDTPWGEHVPNVYISGYGNALIASNHTLFFSQAIHSIVPSAGSLAGGQVVTIRGRGFRSTAEVTFEGVEGACEVMSVSSVEIVCRTPSAPEGSNPEDRRRHLMALPFELLDELSLMHGDTNHRSDLQLTSGGVAAPSVEPTAAPTMIPSEHPTAEPTAAPTQEPTTAVTGPSRAPTMAPTVSTTFVVLVDELSSAERVVYSYLRSLTPRVFSITPAVTSTAVTTNLTISGAHLIVPDAPTIITIAGQECTVVTLLGGYWMMIEEQTITCVLARSRNFGPFRTVDVEVLVPSLGFAGRNDSYTTLPTIERGFQISTVFPAYGSVMGGNVLTISGMGFVAGRLDLHSVTLRQVGLAPFDEYNQLLIALGFPPSTPRKPFEEFNCTILSVTETEVSCRVPAHAASYAPLDYSVTVSLNSIASECGSESSNNCMYSQTLSATPVVRSNVTVLAESTAGVFTFRLEGSLLRSLDSEHSDDHGLQVWVGGLLCTVENVTDYTAANGHIQQHAFVQTPPLTEGLQLITANVRGYGQAHSFASILASINIASVLYDAPEGSIAGGTKMTVAGKGFSPRCAENTVTVTVISSDSSTHDLEVTEFDMCSATSLEIFTPSLLLQLPAHARRYPVSNVDWSVASVRNRVLNSTYSSTIASTSFAYTLAATPLVLVNNTMGYEHTALTVTVFSDLDTMDGTVGVIIGGQPCELLVDQSTPGALVTHNPRMHFLSRYCAAPPLKSVAAPYSVLVRVPPLGYAITNTSTEIMLPAFKSLFLAQPVSPSVTPVSVLAGRKLTISGRGLSNDVTVKVCDKICPYSLADIRYDSITCDIPARWTTAAIDDVQSHGVNLDLIETLTGTYFSSLNDPSSASLAAAHDGSFDTYFDHSSSTCFVGISLPTGYRAQPYRMRFYPRLRFSTYVGTYTFQGSVDGTSYTTLATSKGAHEGWNFLNAPTNMQHNWYQYFRYRNSDSSLARCLLAEVDFLGVVAATAPTCTISVTSASNAITTNVGTVEYKGITEFAPYVQSLSPPNGTALGGQLVTITGTHFSTASPSTEELVVEFSGVPCSVLSRTDTEITCITGRRLPEDIRTSSVTVRVPGRGLAVVSDDVTYLYIDNWSALTSWRNQDPPVEGDFVWIPDGQVLLLDVKTPVLTFLLVEGDLYFDRNQDVSIDSYYIFVFGGYMEVGTDEQPYEKSAIITLHGGRYSTIEIPFVGSKVLAVAAKGLPMTQYMTGQHMPSRTQGQLEVHGQKRLRTWTKLNETAVEGQMWLITSEPVDYKAGERVILTGSERPGGNGVGEEDRNDFVLYGMEEMTVLSTSVDGHNVSFTTPLRFTHRSEWVTIEGRTIDLRVEIGLLSRNVIIQGDDITSDGELFGVHTISFLSGIYRMENAEVRRCGQAFNFGRYCTHSHMAGDMRGSYVKANSIHHSYQRAVTTHRTNNWEVRDNVAYDITGHAYFMEDGTETNNYLSGNLGVFVRRSSALLKSDQKPGVFWTAIPSNFWRDNVACHSRAFGVWFEFEGQIARDLNCPVGQPVGEHTNMTVHSNGGIGYRIYPQWMPLKNPCLSSSGPDPQYLYGLVSFRNGGEGLFGKHHGSIHHIGATFIENGGHDVSIVHLENVKYDKDPIIANALFVGSMNMAFDVGTNFGKFAIYAPQDEFFYVRNATFVNYGTSGALSGCNECLVGSEMNQGGFTTRYQGLKFVNTPLRIFWSDTKKEILWDLDGTLAGVPDSMITRSYKHLRWPGECTLLDPYYYSDSIRCGSATSSVRIRRMQLDDVTPSQLSYTDLIVRSAVGEDEFYFLPLDTYGWVFPVVTGGNRSYSLDWRDAGISAYQMRYTLGRDAYLLESIASIPRIDESVRMDYQPHFWDYTPYSFGVTYAGVRKLAPKNNTLALTKMGQSQYKNATISVELTTKGYKSSTSRKFGVSVDAQICPPGGCPVPPVPEIGIPMLWSQKNSWQNKQLPVAGQKVTIDSNMWIVMDITPPTLGSMVINGKLSFMSNVSYPRSLTLTVKDIAVFGIFEIVGDRDPENNNQTTPFAGQANVVVYGGKGSSLPVIMGEGVFLGSKVIAVSGEMNVHGHSKLHAWTKLRFTVQAGSQQVALSQYVDWKVGDEIVLAPTGYFNSAGAPWSSKNSVAGGSSDEISTIASIFNMTDDYGRIYSQLTLTKPTNHTHLCTVKFDTKFCGAVGVLTRSVRFSSQDSQTPGTSSYGYGANIHVVDYVTSKGAAPIRFGRVNLLNAEFKNFGKINSDKYAIGFQYRDYNHPASRISNCSFNQGYNFATRAEHSFNFSYSYNVAVGNWGGGVFIAADNLEFSVFHNLIVGARQLPSVLLSSYPWLRPIAGVTIHSASGICKHNLVAGSEDQGFAIATAMFHLPHEQRQTCSVTHATAYAYNAEMISTNALFAHNEAVGCRGGLMVVAMSPSESSERDCAAVTGFMGWRSGHTGILVIDAMAHIVVANVHLAENHIGITIHSYKASENLFNGVVASTIIGSLSDGDDLSCTDLPDSFYVRNQECNAFTESDPLGLLTSCSSVIHGIYRRVGVLLPQWTNKPQTCAIAGRFDQCEPPTTPDRLCLLPWEKRYGLPVDIAYAEQHIHDVTFLGFRNQHFNDAANTTGSCIPSATSDRSAAIAINPTQYDMQPNVIMSGLQWQRSDTSARFGFDVGAYGNAECRFKPCSGHNMILFHDLDGSANAEGVPAQLSYKNPSYVAPYPLCYEVPALSNGLYACPRTTVDPQPNNRSNSDTTEFRQYTALWRDWGPQIIQPIITSRAIAGENRSFASFGPIDDMCAKRFYFSRFPMLLSVGGVHKVMSTGTIPGEFMIRWDAPSENDATVVQFFVQHSQAINVLVSNDPVNGFRNVPKGFVYPTVNDAAGTNMRDPYNRFLAVTLRGGAYRYYRFRQVPVAAVTIRMDMTLATFFADTFVANMATLLRITIDRIKITDVRAGSVIADFDISPANTVAENSTAVTNQIDELTSVTAVLSQAIVSGEIATALNVTVMEVYAVPPVATVVLDQNLDIAENDTSFNITAYRETQIALSTPKVEILLTFPTSMPTGQPTHQPSTQPTRAPSALPTSRPSTQPTSTPTQPTSTPTGKPTLQPVATPTAAPSSHPSAAPTSQPSTAPTSTPTRSPRPTSQPSSTPTMEPSSQPSGSPTAQPVLHPTAAPTSQPSTTPSSEPSSSPTSSPSALPTGSPTGTPSSEPSSHPSAQPQGHPTARPSMQPSSQPSASPSAYPTRTRAPIFTSRAETTVSFECGTNIEGPTAAEFDEDAEGAFIYAVTNSTAMPDVSTDVDVTSVTDVAVARRRLTGGGPGIAIEYRVILTLLRIYETGTDFNSSAVANSAYSSFRASLLEALENENFVKAMQRSGLAVFQNISVDASSFTISGFSVEVTDRTPTVSPTAAPSSVVEGFFTNGDKLDVGMIVGVTVGGFAFLCIVAGLIYYRYRMLKKKSKPEQIVCGVEDNFMDLEEFYPANSTRSPFANQIPRGSLVHTEVGDAAVLWENGSEASVEERNEPLALKADVGQEIGAQFAQPQVQRLVRYSVSTMLAGPTILTDDEAGEGEQKTREQMDIEERGKLTPLANALGVGSNTVFAFDDAPTVITGIDLGAPTAGAGARGATEGAIGLDGEFHPYFYPDLFTPALSTDAAECGATEQAGINLASGSSGSGKDQGEELRSSVAVSAHEQPFIPRPVAKGASSANIDDVPAIPTFYIGDSNPPPDASSKSVDESNLDL